MTDGNLDSFDPNDTLDVKYLESIISVIKKSLEITKLDLTGLTVLTEAATGHWIFTPFIAAMSNASSIICIVKTSSYGNANDIIQNFNKLKIFLGFDNIEIHQNLSSALIQKSDIITNSGHVRPIDKNFIDSMKDTAVISLMWEPWEYRESDLDLSYCWKKGIAILGVNEDNEILNIMKYVENLIEKIININNLKLKNKKIILIAENKSAHYMIKPLQLFSNSVFFVSQSMASQLKNWGANVVGSTLSDPSVEDFLKDSDLIIINSHPMKSMILGGNGYDIKKLKKISPNVEILVFFGNVDFDEIKKQEIKCYPDSSPFSEHMEWNLDILDFKPTVELCVLGLKAVESLSKDRKLGIDAKTCIEKSKNNPFSLDFSIEQKKKYCY